MTSAGRPPAGSTFLRLPPEYVARVRAYFAALVDGRFPESKSEYWADHAARARLTFADGGVWISGASGFYIPPAARGSARHRLRCGLHRLYKRGVVGMDRLLRLSTRHDLSSLLTYDLAYDYVMSGRTPVGEDEEAFRGNPFRFDATVLRPLFKTAQALRRGWFLKDRYLPNAHIYLAGYHHAVFRHFANGGLRRYLEIGAGNGNLASFFRHYDGSTICVLDLPETLLYSSCYLASIFPDARVLLPHEAAAPLRESDLDRYDFVFLVPSQAPLLPARAFDLIVNTASMQEMTRSQIAEYVSLVQLLGKRGGLWCNVNRVEKFISRCDRPIRSLEFPYHAGNQVLMDQVDPYMRLVQMDHHVMHVEKICAGGAQKPEIAGAC